MDSLAHGIRLVVGLGMVAAGTALAAPTALHVAAWWQPRETVPGVLSAPSLFGPDSVGGVAHVPFASPPPPAGGGRRLEYVPPPTPPEPLPPSSQALASAMPDLGAAYRSALQSPPPPLLDGQSPPPLAVGWTGRDPATRAAANLRPASEPSGAYVVRDGDDLTGLATRFYGNPAAAAAIWQANRGLLGDPRLLPIGMTLVLPHPSQVAALMRPGDQVAIEPGAERPQTAARPMAVSSSPWLATDPVSGPGQPSP